MNFFISLKDLVNSVEVYLRDVMLCCLTGFKERRVSLLCFLGYQVLIRVSPSWAWHSSSSAKRKKIEHLTVFLKWTSYGNVFFSYGVVHEIKVRVAGVLL